MTVSQRKEVTRKILALMSQSGSEIPTGPCLHQDIYNFVSYCDDWLETEQANFNSNIPQPAKAFFATKEKSLFLSCVMDERYKVSNGE